MSQVKSYRKRPVVIEAIQWDARKATWDELKKMGMDEWSPGQIGSDSFLIKTLEGEYKVRKGDWIIKGISGELYPCKPEIFELTYEEF